MKINKKLIIFLGLMGGLLLVGEAAHADELKESLRIYLNDPSFDLFGREFDKILFQNVTSAETMDQEFWEKVIEDIRWSTNPELVKLQVKCLWKILQQNKYTYGAMGGLAGLKSIMGKEFGTVLLKIFKIVAK